MKDSNVAAKLRQLRGDVPRADVAKSVGISVSALGMYECGERMPRDAIKKKLASHYNTSVEAIFFAE